MRAYQCDRCGKLYSYSNKRKNEIFITSSCTMTGRIKDLCDECQKELEAWWKAGKAEDADKIENKTYGVKVINRGNCILCGKKLTEGLLFCKECEKKIESEEQ